MGSHATPCHSHDHQVLPTQPLPRYAEDFTKGGKYTKNVALATYLDYFQQV